MYLVLLLVFLGLGKDKECVHDGEVSTVGVWLTLVPMQRPRYLDQVLLTTGVVEVELLRVRQADAHRLVGLCHGGSILLTVIGSEERTVRMRRRRRLLGVF